MEQLVTLIGIALWSLLMLGFATAVMLVAKGGVAAYQWLGLKADFSKALRTRLAKAVKRGDWHGRI